VGGNGFNLDQLTVSGLDQYGNIYDISGMPVTWSITSGSQFSTINAGTSVLSPIAAGTGTVVATVGGITSNALDFTVNSSGGGGGGGGAAVSYTPTVQTEAASTVTTTSAVLNGEITSDNGYNVSDYGFLWGTSSNNLTNKLDVGTNNQSGSFTATLSNLTAGTTYYFKAYATNSQGTTKGAALIFTTAGGAQAPITTTTPTTITAPAFSDVPASYWAYAAINSLCSQGIVSGYPDGTFKPSATVTRAEFATMLVKALGLNTTGVNGTFADVTPDSWYYNSVNYAVYAGLASGMSNGLFAPNDPITREQIAVMIVKALGKKAPTIDGTELNAFTDKSEVSSWAVNGMEEAVKAGIISGMTTNTIAPQADATRAQATAMIFKLLNIFGK
jgi:hypothetical protein